MNKSQKNLFVRIILSFIFGLVAWLLPAKGVWKLLVFLVPYFIAGRDVLKEALENILHGEIFGEALLMSIATVGALILGEYAEAVAVMVFFQIGALFESLAVEKSRDNITSLLDLRPEYVTVRREAKEYAVPAAEVAVGETVIIKPGERIPLDGILIDGNTTVDTSALTGESMPRSLSVGDSAVSGCMNLSGRITIQTTGTLSESTVSRILSLIESAADRKSHAEGLISRFAKYYTPCVVIGALLLALLPPIFVGNWIEWIRRGLIFLVVSCPCALVISVPLSFFAAIGGASRNGILIKGSEYLESLAKLKTVAFDKTGTLTQGRFSVSAIRPNNIDSQSLLLLAAAVEQHSTHPLAVSIVNACADCELLTAEAIAEHAGMGIEATVDGTKYFVGNLGLMSYAGLECLPVESAGTCVYVAKGTEYLGSIVLSDTIKPQADTALRNLQKLGITHTVLLTGDRKEAATQVADALQLSEYYAELLPADKVSRLEDLMNKGNTVAFVGDGINDAPVLTRADIGIAMGSLGSEAAIEAADIVLMDDNLMKLPHAIRIARKAMRIVKENIIFALLVKFTILLFSAVGVLGATGMWIAVFADVGVMVLSVLNALRAFFVKP